MKIFIDAGHGGSNPGAVGPNGLKESDVNLDVALRLGRLLSSRKSDRPGFVPVCKMVLQSTCRRAILPS